MASSTILFLAALVFIPLSWLEHTRSLRPSAILEIYFALSIPLGIIQCKTLWMIRGFKPIAVIFTVMLVTRLIALLAESQGKRRILLSPYRNVPPDGTNGVFGLLSIAWLFPLMRRGFTSTLSLQNLLQLNKEMASKTLLESTSQQWNSCTYNYVQDLSYADKTLAPQKNLLAMFMGLLSQQKYTFFVGGAFRLCLVALRFSQPFLVQAELGFSSGRQSAPVAKGSWLVVGYAGVFFGIMVRVSSVMFACFYVLTSKIKICRSGYQYHTRKLVVKVRGSLISFLYSHMLRMDPAKASEAGPTSLISVDMERIVAGLLTMHETWASLMEVCLFIWMIQRQIHLAAVASAITSLSKKTPSFLFRDLKTNM